MNAPPIEVRDLNKRYKNGTWGNRDLSLTVEPGELLSIVGPNGAGKTTLVRQVTTELVPTSGEVRIFGVDGVSHPNEAKGYMGVMPQEANLFWGLSAWHHLRIFGKLRGLPPKMASRRAEELISELGLVGHRDKASQELSGGLRRRLLVGIASVSKPPLLDPRRTQRRSRPRIAPQSLGPPSQLQAKGLHRVADHTLHGRGRDAQR